ncbi:MAG TPA: vitamin K epoxide reductase family protein, partial [Mucilaginibacter sp.]|nr:vitamin K epoxide reductase family protein [Mucilaginibacter sp.]
MQHYLTKLLEPRANGPEITTLFASLLNVKISALTLTKEIEEHADYPSLLSISDVLNTYGIENLAVKFDITRFAELPAPFITQITVLKSDIKFFTIVREIKEEIVYFFDPERHNWRALAKSDFLQRCTGVALFAEAEENAGEKDYGKNLKKEKKKNALNHLAAFCMPVVVAIAGIVALTQDGSSALLPFVFSILTLVGTAVGALLLLYELDQHNPVLQQICSGSKKVDCGAVLQSKAAKIAGISWSAIGFIYFMGLLLLLLLGGIASPSALFVGAWMNALAVPYVVFSVYYQWRVVKQWCVLCLIVVTVLILQLTIATIGGWHTLLRHHAIDPALLMQAITAFAFPVIIAFLLIPALQKAKEGKRTHIELQKLKHNKQIFAALLPRQKLVTENPDNLGIVMGNPNATFKLIKVCNPYCGPCAKAHSPIEALLHNNPDLQVQVIFTAKNDEKDP